MFPFCPKNNGRACVKSIKNIHLQAERLGLNSFLLTLMLDYLVNFLLIYKVRNCDICYNKYFQLSEKQNLRIGPFFSFCYSNQLVHQFLSKKEFDTWQNL